MHPILRSIKGFLGAHHPFAHVRHAFLAWLLFAVVMASTGLYALVQVPSVQAAPDFSIQTGYYQGTGAALSITGLGFTPQVVLIKADTAAGSLVWKSSTMPAPVTSYLGVATADNNETQITLQADGFSVSQALEVNTVNVRYTYVAYEGSDCTATGVFCVGTYSGDANATQNIVTGFQPDLVWVKRSTAVAATFRTSSMSVNHAAFFTATANDTTGVYFQTLNSNGFTVGSTNNTNGGVFYYVAVKNTAGKLTVGQFTGDGVDNRDISGLGFEPDFVFVKQNSAIVPAFNTTEMNGDFSSVTTAAVNAVNHIQELQADGFQVGNSTSVNALGIVSHYFAFGGASDPVPAGSFFMQRGSYVGNGTSQLVETTFMPDLVFIKGNTTEYAVWSTSLATNLTQYFSLSAVGFVGGVTSHVSNGFNVGSHGTTNSNGVTYEYIAYGNATSPITGPGASDFFIGSYTGNGLTPRTIDHLGIDPDMVVIKRPITTATLSVWASSAMAANTTAHFSATADVVDGTAIRTLNSDGFTVGTAGTVNSSGVTYLYFGFKEGSYFDVGTYAGNGVVDTEIATVGFASDFVWTKRDTAVAGVHKSSSGTIAALNSQHFNNLANDTNDIKTFTASGFTVGNSAEVNTVGGNYRYAAWDSSTSSSPPNTPSNVAPIDDAANQDLNVALSASAYVDVDLNAQLDAQWQVDNDANFLTPVWTRTAGVAETSTSVTAGNGTFANELLGKTELNHAETYYWRVRYSDSVWSAWSSHTEFSTNSIATPTLVSPVDGDEVPTLTPTLTASAFSDAQPGHTAASAQWQIDTTDAFLSPVYDSGTVAYSNIHAVPDARLSDHTVYYWRVRYRDSSGMWSYYSLPSRFLVAQAHVVVTPLFGSVVVDQGDALKIDAQVKLANGTVVNGATATISIFNPSGVKIVDAAAMPYLSASSGIYRYTYTAPSVNGSYLYEVTAVEDGRTGYGAANFEIRTISTDITDVQSTVNAEQIAQTAERSSQAAERAAQASERTAQGAERVDQAASRATVAAEAAAQAVERAAQALERVAQATERADQSTSRSVVTDIQTKANSILANIDVLVGAMIVTQSSVNDASASTTSFISALTNVTTDFYKNAVLTFTSGVLDGQSRRVSGYNGGSKVITLDPALTSAPANSDTFTITTQNVRVEEQVATHEIAEAAFRADTTARLTAIEGKVDDVLADLNVVDTNLDAASAVVTALRTTQLKQSQVLLSDVSAVQAGATYRATLTVMDVEAEPTDAAATPMIMIYDATRAIVQTATAMTRLSEGVYEYTYAILPGATAGLWESIVTTDVGGTNDVVTNDYWQVTGSPAQVLINAVTDVTVPTIVAASTITNEGANSFEYQYEWCVVVSEGNQCGGGDDVFHGTAAKLIDPGEDFNTNLAATVATPGSYWFKLKVYFGTESSGASLMFTATADTGGGGGGGSSGSGNVVGGGGGTSIGQIPVQIPGSTGNVLTDLQATRTVIAENSAKLDAVLAMLGIVDPNIRTLLAYEDARMERLHDIQNTLADLRAVSSVTRRLVEQNSVEPVIETYMKFNSIEIHFLISNPDTQARTVKFKAFLPAEAKPEHVMDLNGLQIDYDTSAGVYFVSGDIRVDAKSSVTRKVEMKDIWVFTDDEIASLKNQASALLPVLLGTQYEAQGILLKNDIDTTLGLLKVKQAESYTSPQDHIVVYRENIQRMERVKMSVEKMTDLVVQAGATRGVVGQVGGIQTFAARGIVLAIISGFGMLALIIFAMWRQQTLLAAATFGGEGVRGRGLNHGRSTKVRRVGKRST